MAATDIDSMSTEHVLDGRSFVRIDDRDCAVKKSCATTLREFTEMSGGRRAGFFYDRQGTVCTDLGNPKMIAKFIDKTGSHPYLVRECREGDIG